MYQNYRVVFIALLLVIVSSSKVEGSCINLVHPDKGSNLLFYDVTFLRFKGNTIFMENIQGYAFVTNPEHIYVRF